ncbi:hypothetical protein F5X99DRAFT_199065 [Biscogniauxia marginata]|nr:hypothetical protein F5X99DRAFT_199065 [Biscogniauxia marginata]
MTLPAVAFVLFCLVSILSFPWCRAIGVCLSVCLAWRGLFCTYLICCLFFIYSMFLLLFYLTTSLPT